MLAKLKHLSTQRWPWLALTALALAIEAGALYLQHVLQVQPCNECIYIRASVLAVALAGLIGAVAPRYWLLRALAFLVWLAALVWGLQRSFLLLGLERAVSNGSAASCERFMGFPSWLALEQWLPEVFEPRAICGQVSWTFLGQSVTFWAVLALIGLAVLLLAVLLAQIWPAKSSN